MTCKAFLENAAQLEIERLTKENGELKAEIARLSAPLGGAAISWWATEYARRFVAAHYYPHEVPNGEDNALLSSVTEYFGLAVEAAQREARAQMREERSQAIQKWIADQFAGKTTPLNFNVTAIRALPGDPPPQEKKPDQG